MEIPLRGKRVGVDIRRSLHDLDDDLRKDCEQYERLSEPERRSARPPSAKSDSLPAEETCACAAEAVLGPKKIECATPENVVHPHRLLLERRTVLDLLHFP